MITKEKIAEDINCLGHFCGKRDIKELSREELQSQYGMEQADVMVLFGGSIMCGGDVLGKAIQKRIAKKYIIVGGAGHTTETLRQRVHQEFPDIETAGLTEAQIFNAYVKKQYGVEADYLECKSTNCGNNITYLLDLLKENKIVCHSIILSQDATMQRRMEAGFQKNTTDQIEIINFATYQVKVVCQNDELVFQNVPYGMWNMDRYIMLLMGEIPRLSDDENGYGPKGKDFIAHVDIPEEVRNAFEELKETYKNSVREANPEFASS